VLPQYYVKNPGHSAKSSCGRLQLKERRQVSWTLTKRLTLSFAGQGEIMRREVVLDPQVSPEQTMSR